MSNKLDEAYMFLQSIGMPSAQCTNICCYTLLSLANIQEEYSWKEATNNWMRIHDILQFIRDNYKVTYAENSREAIRKQALHMFRMAAIVEDNNKATNSPNFKYRLTDEALMLLKSINNDLWTIMLEKFLYNHQELIDSYNLKKQKSFIPINVEGQEFSLSLGKHNQLQKSIIEEFIPRFARNCRCIYIGDTVKRDLFKDEIILRKLNLSISTHDKLPDIVLYDDEKNWLYFIEAVTSVGPINIKRLAEIEEMTKTVIAGKIYITAFLDFKTYKKFVSDIAWETEIWIAEIPDHMIHMNGDKFIGPR